MTATRTVIGDFIQMVQHHLQGVEWSLNSTLALLWRRWTVIATCVGAMLALAVLLLLVSPAQYTAQGLLQINSRQEKVMDIESVVSGLDPTDAAIRTEIDVLKSRKLARRVIEKMNLLEHPDFGGGVGLLGGVTSMVKFMFIPGSTDMNATKDEADAKITRAIDIFLDRLNVAATPRSFSITVQFTASEAKFAADVVNELSQQYLTSQLEDRLEAARRATTWMGDRAKQLQKRLQAAELAVQKFREANNLTQARGVTLTEQQISELNSQLILARTELAEVTAKAGNQGAASNSSEVLNSPLIQNLRVQETQVRREMSDLSAKYGARHPRMVTIRNELADVQRKIAEESSKIRQSLHTDVDVAQARVRTLEQQLETLQKETSMSNDAEVQLAELERQADAERSLYESFLNRSKQIAQLDFAQSDARVIYAAESPLKPSAPKKKLILLLSVILGAGLGVGIILLLEALDSGFRTSQQVEGATNVPVLGMLGELPGDVNAVRYVLEKPTSAFAEGVRAVRTALGFASPDKKIKVTMVTSSCPQEGKSVFAAALAQVSAMGGASVLLIDADMRRPTQAKMFGLEPKAGLAELLSGQATLKSVIQHVKGTNLSILPSLSNAQFAQELLSSDKMKGIMADLRKEFDLIVIDSPPVMAVADALTLSSLADASLYMVRWGSTPRPLAVSAIRQMEGTPLGVTGAVITRVDMERHKAYGYGDHGYYYGKYKDYYTE